CRVATGNLDRRAANLVCRRWQGNQESLCWRRATPRGRPDTTPARRPRLPTQPRRRTPQNANSNTRPISFERSFSPPSGAKTTPLWRDYVRAMGRVQRNLKPCLTAIAREKAFSAKEMIASQSLLDLATESDKSAPQPYARG